MSHSLPPPNQLSNLESGGRPALSPYLDGPAVRGECRLLGPTALVVQGLMGGLVILSLVVKRYREKPMRPWAVWSFDVSKQALGQAFVHGVNILISDIIAHIAKGNPCDLYFLNILVDTTLGIGYIYLVLHSIDNFLTNRLKLKGFKSGEYGDPPSLAYWARQATVYVLTILTMKLLVIGLFAIWPGIFNIAEFLLSWTGDNTGLRVIFVMGVFPIFMNVLQFWIIDSIVKASTSLNVNRDRGVGGGDADREPLFQDDENDHDEDDDETIRAQRRHDIESPPTPQAKFQPSKGDNSESKVNGSGSSSTVTNSSCNQLHPYPPISTSALSTTSSSPLSPSSSSSVSSLRSKKSRRRSPPPPIQRPPHLSNDIQYTISTTPSPMMTRSQSISQLHRSPGKARQRRTSSQTQINSQVSSFQPVDVSAENDWTQHDNWAEKVGEEEWTGRRLGAAKAVLEAWGTQTSIEVS